VARARPGLLLQEVQWDEAEVCCGWGPPELETGPGQGAGNGPGPRAGNRPGPRSWKWAQAEEPGSAGPSKRAQSQLFISELGSDNEEVWVVAETVKVRTRAGNQVGEECQEMVEALQAHTASIQLQVDAQEQMGHQVEHLVQAMDLHRDAQEVLASALLQLSSPIGAQLGPEEEWARLGVTRAEGSGGEVEELVGGAENSLS